MKKLIFCLGLLFVFCLSATAAEIEEPHVSVVGSATEEIVPDKMLWHLFVSNKDMELLKASTDHRTSVNRVLTILKKVNIPEDKIQTTRMSYGENLVRKGNNYVKEGYIASTTIIFTLENFSNYNQLWTDLAKVPGVSIKAVNYDSSKREETVKNVRAKALLNAREKAKAMANTLSAKLGDVLVIEDQSYPIIQTWGTTQYEPYYLSTMDYSGAATKIPIALGKIPVTMNISVAFKLNTAD